MPAGRLNSEMSGLVAIISARSADSQLNGRIPGRALAEGRSVANFTRRDAEEFLTLAAETPITTVADPYPLTDANIALSRLKSGDVNGAAVLTV